MTATLILTCVLALVLGFAAGAWMRRPKGIAIDPAAHADAQAAPGRACRIAGVHAGACRNAGRRAAGAPRRTRRVAGGSGATARTRARGRRRTGPRRPRPNMRSARAPRPKPSCAMRRSSSRRRFTELAGKAFHERGQQFEHNVRLATGQSKSDIELLLKPFADQLGDVPPAHRHGVRRGSEGTVGAARRGAGTQDAQPGHGRAGATRSRAR